MTKRLVYHIVTARDGQDPESVGLFVNKRRALTEMREWHRTFEVFPNVMTFYRLDAYDLRSGRTLPAYTKIYGAHSKKRKDVDEVFLTTATGNYFDF